MVESVSEKSSRKHLVNFVLSEDVHSAFKLFALKRGVSMSSLLQGFVSSCVSEDFIPPGGSSRLCPEHGFPLRVDGDFLVCGACGFRLSVDGE